MSVESRAKAKLAESAADVLQGQPITTFAWMNRPGTKKQVMKRGVAGAGGLGGAIGGGVGAVLSASAPLPLPPRIRTRIGSGLPHATVDAHASTTSR